MALGGVTRNRAATGRGIRVEWLVSGSAVLLVSILVGAFLQVGVSACAVCGPSSCGPTSGVCAGSLLGLALILLALAVGAMAIAVGLRAALPHRTELGRSAPPGVEEGTGARVPSEFLAPFSVVLGGAMIALGALLPWSAFGYCRDGTCSYPYALAGIPLSLVATGAVLAASGEAVMVLLRRRN